SDSGRISHVLVISSPLDFAAGILCQGRIARAIVLSLSANLGVLAFFSAFSPPTITASERLAATKSRLRGTPVAGCTGIRNFVSAILRKMNSMPASWYPMSGHPFADNSTVGSQENGACIDAFEKNLDKIS